MKYFFIAGEASGDLHASNLIKELHLADPNISMRGFGGELMQQAGMELVRHYKETAFMGFIPVIMNLSKIRHNFELAKQSILEFKPDVLVLIDYPGFNLKMAAFAKEHGIKVFYYIPPKVWIWKKRRVKEIKRLVDEVFTIFPFETEFYAKNGIEVNYVGNPVMDAVLARKTDQSTEDFKTELELSHRPILALVPGSREQEIKSLLPLMLKGTEDVSSHQLLVTAAPNMPVAFYHEIMKGYDAKLVHDKTYEVIQHADLAVVASGTVTLETAVLNCPQVVCYKMGGGAFLYYVGKWFVGITFVSLVNIILKRMAVQELLQHFCSAINIKTQVIRIIEDANWKNSIFDSYAELSEVLGGGGASKKAAKLMIEKLEK